MNFPTVTDARTAYESLGFDTLPLLPGEKKATQINWQFRRSSELWAEADPNANIANRCGGIARLVVIDCDDDETPGTYDRVVRYLDSIGIVPGSYPVVRSASGCLGHIYLRRRPCTLHGHAKLLSHDFGAGELRYGSGAYVVAPPSRVGNNTVCLESGSFDNIPDVDIEKLLALVSPSAVREMMTADEGVNGPSPCGVLNGCPGSSASTDTTARRRLPRRAYRLLSGQGLDHFPSRSEAEASIVLSLINAGHSFEDILALFRRYPGPGKFSEQYRTKPRAAERYLRTTYESQLAFARRSVNPYRKCAEGARAWAMSRPWRGRTGLSDRAVYVAHAQIAFNASRETYSASARELAELAGVSKYTASRATGRLQMQGLIERRRTKALAMATTYALVWPPNGDTLPEATASVTARTNLVSHDAFCYAGLGKSAAEVVEALMEGPKTDSELMAYTGRCRQTIRRVLARLMRVVDIRTGEILNLVVCYEERWEWLGHDLDEIAAALGTSGYGQRRQNRHAQERRAYRESLGRRRRGDGN